MEKRAKSQALVESIVTEGRVHKLVNKMVDDGIIPENWDEHNMSTIAKNIGKDVYYDCVKEEKGYSGSSRRNVWKIGKWSSYENCKKNASLKYNI